MAETAITVKETSGRYPTLPLAANSADFAFGVIDAVDGGAFVSDGTEIILVQNTDAGATTFTITSQKDQYGRTGDIAAYALQTTEFAVFAVGGPGWADVDGKVHVKVSDADVKIAVIRPKR